MVVPGFFLCAQSGLKMSWVPGDFGPEVHDHADSRCCLSDIQGYDIKRKSMAELSAGHQTMTCICWKWLLKKQTTPYGLVRVYWESW